MNKFFAVACVTLFTGGAFAQATFTSPSAPARASSPSRPAVGGEPFTLPVKASAAAGGSAAQAADVTVPAEVPVKAAKGKLPAKS